MNMLTIKELSELEEFVNQNRLMEVSLSFKNQKLTDDQVIEFIKTLKKLHKVHLLSLDFSGNDITSVANKALIDLFCLDITVDILILDLTNNRLENQGAIQWAEFLIDPKAPASIALSLRMNRITNIGAEKLAKTFENPACCPTLEIDIRTNSFPIKGHMAISQVYSSPDCHPGLKIYCEDMLEKSSEIKKYTTISFLDPYPDAPDPRDNPYIRGVWPKEDNGEEDNIFTISYKK